MFMLIYVAKEAAYRGFSFKGRKSAFGGGVQGVCNAPMQMHKFETENFPQTSRKLYLM